MSFTQKIIQYFKDVRSELGRVHWPSRAQTIRYTTIVILISLITAAFLGAFDSLFLYLITKWITRG